MKRQGPEAEPITIVPTLRMSTARGTTRAVVLVLHGGRSVSREVSMTSNLAVLRMIPIARKIRRATRRDGVAVWRLRYRYRGWNGSEASPVADARWALEEVRRLHGDVPVVLVGHSMGGRVAAHVADDPSVVGLVGLAPWLQSDDPVDRVAGEAVRLFHGDRDRITSAGSTAAWARRAERYAGSVVVRTIDGGEHFMLRHWRLWHRLVADATREVLAAVAVAPSDRAGRS